MQSSTMTTKGQVTIPAKIRKKLGLRAGDQVEFILYGDRAILLRREKDIEAAFGLVKTDRSASLNDMDEAIRTGTIK
jgi:antitoxin PrlF